MSETATKRRRKPSLEAAIKVARKAGACVTEAVVEPDGTVRLRLGEPEKASTPDSDLDLELEAFERQHGES